MKWEKLGCPLEMKQGFSEKTVDACRTMAHEIAEKLRNKAQ